MIRINERFAIKADEKQFILVELVTRTKEKTGEEYQAESFMGYFRDVSGALEGL